jgi:hypothetical protein
MHGAPLAGPRPAVMALPVLLAACLGLPLAPPGPRTWRAAATGQDGPACGKRGPCRPSGRRTQCPVWPQGLGAAAAAPGAPLRPRAHHPPPRARAARPGRGPSPTTGPPAARPALPPAAGEPSPTPSPRPQPPPPAGPHPTPPPDAATHPPPCAATTLRSSPASASPTASSPSATSASRATSTSPSARPAHRARW